MDLQAAFDEREAEVRQAFDEFDKDGNGEIDLGEFRALVEALGLTMNPAKAEALFDEIDDDHSGLVGYDEFHHWWDRVRDEI